MRVLLGIVIGFVLVFVGVYLYFRLGLAPVATAAQPMPFEKAFAQDALRARINKEAPTTVPIQPDARNMAEGVRTYRESCAVCHGLRGQEETMIAKGMFPKPPQFFSHPAKSGGAVGHDFWVVKNGIRMTGMPSFGTSLNDEEIWQVALMLDQRDKLPEDLERLLSEPAGPASEAATKLRTSK